MFEIFHSLFDFVCDNSAYAHYIISALILLAGLNVPLSEDVLLLIAGAIASTCFPQSALYMYAWVFAACLIAGWEAYWIGRIIGPKLLTIRWFNHVLSEERLKKMKVFYQKYGLLSFVVGRFIPGGVRNALFMSSGLTKMPFPLFVFRDFIGGLLATGTIFYLGYAFGSNYHTVLYYLAFYQKIFIVVFAFVLLIVLVVLWLRAKRVSSEI